MPFEQDLVKQIKKYHAILRKNPSSRTFMRLAELYLKIGLPEKAIHLLRESLKRHPKDIAARLGLGRMYLICRQLKDAAREFKEVIRQDPQQFMAYKLLGEVAMQEQEHEKAAERFGIAYKLNPEDPECKVMLDYLSSLLGRDVAPKVGGESTAQAPIPAAAPTPAVSPEGGFGEFEESEDFDDIEAVENVEELPEEEDIEDVEEIDEIPEEKPTTKIVDDDHGRLLAKELDEAFQDEQKFDLPSKNISLEEQMRQLESGGFPAAGGLSLEEQMRQLESGGNVKSPPAPPKKIPPQGGYPQRTYGHYDVKSSVNLREVPPPIESPAQTETTTVQPRLRLHCQEMLHQLITEIPGGIAASISSFDGLGLFASGSDQEFPFSILNAEMSAALNRLRKALPPIAGGTLQETFLIADRYSLILKVLREQYALLVLADTTAFQWGITRVYLQNLLPQLEQSLFGTDSGSHVLPLISDDVVCTVFCPPIVTPGECFLVQVFAHLAEKAAEAARLARTFDQEAVQRGVTSLNVSIERNSTLTFVLEMSDGIVHDPLQTLIWQGRTEPVTFGVELPEKTSLKNLMGKVTISQNSVPIGHIRFLLKVKKEAPERERSPEFLGQAKRYRYAFVSYSTQDRVKVLQRVQMLSLLQIQFFQDLLSIEPGDIWEPKIYQELDRADVFFLFWSHAARQSVWVNKEIRYVLQRKQGHDDYPPEIVPVIIDGPPPPSPPKELQHLNFHDKLTYFINFHEKEETR